MNVIFSVYGYNPDVDNVPYMRIYRLDIPEGSIYDGARRTGQLRSWITSPSAAPAAKGYVDLTVSAA